MEIDGEIMKELGIENVYLTIKGQNCLCCLIRIDEEKWYCMTNAALDADDCIMHVKYGGEYFSLGCRIERLIDKNECILRVVDEKQGVKRISEIFESVREMEKRTKMENRRKEKRYEIGEMIETIGFDRPEQTVIAHKKSMSCVVRNVSYSGACIITYDDGFMVGERICMLYSFVSPIAKMAVPALIRCVEKKSIKGGEYSLLSMEYEKVPLQYRLHVEKCAKEDGEKEE